MTEPTCPVCEAAYAFTQTHRHALSPTADGGVEMVIETTYEPCGHTEREVVER